MRMALLPAFNPATNPSYASAIYTEDIVAEAFFTKFANSRRNRSLVVCVLKRFQEVRCGPRVAVAEDMVSKGFSKAKLTKDPVSHAPSQETEDTMGGSNTPRVLLLRDEPTGCFSLVDWLQQSGYKCQIATSPREAVALLGKAHFHVVLSEFSVSVGNTHRLISQVTGSAASLFFRLEMEDGCLWLPAVVRGQDCWGTSAMRPKEFHPVLKELLRQMPSGTPQNSCQDSAVCAQLLPSAGASWPVDNETAPMDSRAQADSTGRRRKFAT